MKDHAHLTSGHDKRPRLQPATVEDFAEALRAARATNRQIVPIVGAGLSADCGFPVITAIVRYFGKLYRYIEEQAPLQKADLPAIAHLQKVFDGYKEKPWEFIEHFGWPDRFQLNQDLYAILLKQNQDRPSENVVEDAVREGLDRVLRDVNPQGYREYKALCDDIKEKVGHVSDGLNEDARKALAEALERLDKNWSKSVAFDIVGDWRRLILFFTNYRSDYADALFARFGSSRQPSQGHRFLAFLVKSLAVPTVFTFNFDSLIEQVLESEGAHPRVFAMERGAGLPHAGLVRDHLSVIKMHGSTHALLLDEQLDRPLSAEYLQRFADITGKDPLLLVVGCSDGDRRLRDLVADVVSRSNAANGNLSVSPSVLWLHYEEEAPRFLGEVLPDHQSQSGKILVRATNNPGATLQHLYSWLYSCNPAGNLPYLAHIHQPVHLRKPVSEQDSWPDKNSFEVISSLPRKTQIPSASHELLKRANHWARNGYQFVWVDLESVHTFAGVVGAIIDQCRKYDPDLAPSVLPVNIDDGIGREGQSQTLLENAIDLAAKRVGRALRRTRYYLAIDGLETYVWAATMHHGVSRIAIQEGAADRLKNLVKFLVKLNSERATTHGLGESLVGVSVDDAKSRHDDYLNSYIQLEQRVKELEERASCSNALPADEFDFDADFEPLKDFPLLSLKNLPEGVFPGTPDQQKARWALVLLNLSCFRRMRPLVAMRRLLDPLLSSAGQQGRDGVEKILEPLVERWNGQVIQRLEGGGYWFSRAIRNKVYEQNTRLTDKDPIRMCLNDWPDHRPDVIPADDWPKLCRNSAFQLFLVATTHQRIARTWYTRIFMQSQDTFAFFEYTYHRISSIRNLAKLRRLAQVARKETIAREIILGIANCGELMKIADPEAPPLKLLGFENDDVLSKILRAGATILDQKGDAVELIEKVETALMKHHRDELGSLYRAWTRSEVALRTQVPAEQLLHFCDEVLTDDLVHRCNRVVIEYDERKSERLPSFSPVYHKLTSGNEIGEVVDQELEEGEIREFRQYLQDLQAKLWIERSDYRTCIAERWRHLLDNALPGTRDEMMMKYGISKDGPIKQEQSAAMEEDETFIDSCDVLQCHRLLDIVSCKLQWEQESSFHDTELIEKRKTVFELLGRIKKRLGAYNEPASLTEANRLNEAWLRLFHLQAETQLGRISMFSHDGFSGSLNNWPPIAVNLEAVRTTIAEGWTQITTHDARTHQAPRSVVLDPTTDGALYIQYRSVFQLLNGRAEWLNNNDDAFQRALRSFEMARGGLGDDSPLMLALIELYTVEALLGRGRKVLFEATSADEAVRACKLARSLYDSARGGLQRARESLLASRRNVIWRKFFFRLTTQYHSDRLFLGYALLTPMVENLKSGRVSSEKRDECRRACEELLRHFLLRLRRGYHSLLTAVDLFLPQSIDHENREPCPNRFRWLYRMWWELTLCGYSTGRLALTLDEDISPDNADLYVRGQLKWLNETSGIETSELARWVKEKYPLLNDRYATLKAKSKASSPEERAMEERRQLIALAMEAAGGNNDRL